MFIRFQGVMVGGTSGPLILTDFKPPTLEIKNTYRERPAGDGVMVSRDALTKAVWGFSVATNGASLSDALDAAGRLQQAWQAESVRESAYAAYLDYSHDGATWYRVHGRPGRFTSITPDVHAGLGVGRIEMEWVQTDPRIFSGSDRQVRITAVPAIQGGIMAPIVTPITTVSAGGSRSGRVENAGDVAAPLTVVFRGPSTDPAIRSDRGYEMTYRGTLAYDQTVTIDPVRQSVELRTGSKRVQVPGRLSRRSRLSDLTTPPGTSDWSYTAVDETGTSSVDLITRDAYSAYR